MYISPPYSKLRITNQLAQRSLMCGETLSFLPEPVSICTHKPRTLSFNWMQKGLQSRWLYVLQSLFEILVLYFYLSSLSLSLSLVTGQLQS